jgi:hypothetical protein
VVKQGDRGLVTGKDAELEASAKWGNSLNISDSSNVTFMQPSSAVDRLYGLVVRVSGYRSRGPGSIPGATRFSEK